MHWTNKCIRNTLELQKGVKLHKKWTCLNVEIELRFWTTLLPLLFQISPSWCRLEARRPASLWRVTLFLYFLQRKPLIHICFFRVKNLPSLWNKPLHKEFLFIEKISHLEYFLSLQKTIFFIFSYVSIYGKILINSFSLRADRWVIYFHSNLCGDFITGAAWVHLIECWFD